MSSPEDETELNEPDENGHGIKHYLVWFLAAILIMTGLGALVSGSGPIGIVRGLIAAALLITAGIVAIAYTTETEHLEPIRSPLPANTLAVIALILVLTAAGAAIGPTSDTVEDADPGAVDDGDAPTETEAPADDTPDAAGDDDGGGGDGGGGGDTATPEQSVTTLQSIQDVDNRYDDGREQFSGTGQTVTETFSHGGPAMVVVFEHDGSSNFIVELVNAETGDREDVLVNKIGETSGAIAVPAGSSDEYRLNIDADGAWSIEVAEPLPQEDDIEGLPAEASGTGMDVLGPIQLEGNTVVTGEHNGESNFIVRAVDELAMFNSDQELIFNEIGAFEGETLARYEGVVWISVQADGEWTLEFE